MPGTNYVAGNAPVRRRQARVAGMSDPWISSTAAPVAQPNTAPVGGGRLLNMFANLASRSAFGPIAAAMVARRRGG